MGTDLGHKRYSGRLSAADMLSWKLDAELVTLSACETGLGQNQVGEGYVSFAQALFLAGARSLVLSQWKLCVPSPVADPIRVVGESSAEPAPGGSECQERP
jgi:hypothetical protein